MFMDLGVGGWGWGLDSAYHSPSAKKKLKNPKHCFWKEAALPLFVAALGTQTLPKARDEWCNTLFRTVRTVGADGRK